MKNKNEVLPTGFRYPTKEEKEEEDRIENAKRQSYNFWKKQFNKECKKEMIKISTGFVRYGGGDIFIHLGIEGKAWGSFASYKDKNTVISTIKNELKNRGIKSKKNIILIDETGIIGLDEILE